MNNSDFEKTQIWAKNLVNAPIPPTPPPAVAKAQAAAAAFALPKKPTMKKMSKEEKIILATGGALAIGLGAIVITSLSDDQIEALPPVVSKTDLTAPKLDLGTAPEPVAEIHEEPAPPKPHHPAPRQHAEKKEAPTHLTQPPPVAEEHHALLEIPETPEVAIKPDDKQTFIEAFNTARAEVGPAGLFAWHDTYYSTFTDKEWDSVPADQQAKWLDAAEPIIDPGYENLADSIPKVAEEVHHVVVAERGPITWTGIDKNGDGQTEILMARINGQSPMVLMDTDGDGILDKRYDYEAASGKTYASDIQPFSMSAADIEHLEYIPVEQDMGFYNHSGNEGITGSLPVSIFEENGQYVVSMDSNMDNTVDAITYLTDDRGPVVGLDDNNDGQIEMGYVYDTDSQTISSLEMEPMEEMSFSESADSQISYVEESGYVDAFEVETESELALNEDDQDDVADNYFDSNANNEDVNS